MSESKDRLVTREDIERHNPCHSLDRYNRTDPILLSDILKRNDVKAKNKIWVVTKFLDDRTNRLFAVRCAREALKLVQNPDPRSIEACDVAERFALGEATEEELAAAEAAAWSAWSAAWDAVAAARFAAEADAAWFAARSAARSAAEADPDAIADAAEAAVRSAVNTAEAAVWAAAAQSAEAAWDAAAAARFAARSAARSAQLAYLLDILNPTPREMESGE